MYVHHFQSTYEWPHKAHQFLALHPVIVYSHTTGILNGIPFPSWHAISVEPPGSPVVCLDDKWMRIGLSIHRICANLTEFGSFSHYDLCNLSLFSGIHHTLFQKVLTLRKDDNFSLLCYIS